MGIIKSWDIEDIFASIVAIAILIVSFLGVTVTAVLAVIGVVYIISGKALSMMFVKVLYYLGIPAGIVTFLTIIALILAIRIHFRKI